ncbi:phenoloxidase-activating factor 1-like [Diabrotica undecimpunctata]|uniref:phenoloxidase-activating factor 1-like n=1 Tax=Diabrotica undecimpunctata TaxID=50387 RepID=UPI003B634E31
MAQKCYLCLLCIFCIGSFKMVKAERGESCITPTGETGTCVSVYNCKLFLEAFTRKDLLQISFIKRSQCGYDTEPLVCCSSRVDFHRFRRAVNIGNGKTVNFTRSRAIPNRTTCGLQESDNTGKIVTKIFGGTEADLKEFPWMVRLGYINKVKKIEWNCGGSLISSSFVLTAAHCVTKETQASVGRLTFVKLGEHNLTSEIDCDQDGICNQKPIIIGISRIMQHQNYNSKVQSNDIALLKLSKNVSYTDSIRPICLPEPNEESLRSKESLIASGWGNTETGGRSQVKLKVDLPFRTKDECTKAFNKTKVKLNENQICAGGEDGKDSCQGDSGGPLMKKSNADSPHWYQEGITSFGLSACGIEGFPGIYTKVSSFLPWIHQHVTV